MNNIILVAGDTCDDVYLFSNKKKENPEHSSDIYIIDKKIVKPGMASNVYQNCIGMNLVSVLLHNSGERSIEKTRLFYNNEYLSRIDNDSYIPKFSDEDLNAILKYNIKYSDAIIVSDYGKGFWNKERLSLLEEADCAVYIDPYPTRELSDYPSCTAILPNLKEGVAMTGLSDPGEICKKIYGTVYCNEVILKLGDKGAMYFTKGMDEPELIPGESVPVVDVCGAGDTFIAAIASAQTQGNDTRDSIVIANKAAAITVQHQGVYSLNQEEWKKIVDSVK